MNTLESVIKEFHKIIAAIGPALREKDKENVLSLCEHNECGIAYETLCTQLYEFDVHISLETFEMIKNLGKRFEMDSSNWEDLKELIR